MVKDVNGKMVAAKNKLFHGVLNLTLAETVSCKKTLSWVKILCINKVILESDAQQVIYALNNTIFWFQLLMIVKFLQMI